MAAAATCARLLVMLCLMGDRRDTPVNCMGVRARAAGTAKAAARNAAAAASPATLLPLVCPYLL